MNIFKDIKTFINKEYSIIKNEVVQKASELANHEIHKNSNGHLTKTNEKDRTLVQSSDKNKCPFDENEKPIKLKFLLDESTFSDRLHQKSHEKISCNEERCMGSLLNTSKTPKDFRKSKEEIIEQATDFINQFYASVKR